jgi:hypothetical protein
MLLIALEIARIGSKLAAFCLLGLGLGNTPLAWAAAAWMLSELLWDVRRMLDERRIEQRLAGVERLAEEADKGRELPTPKESTRPHPRHPSRPQSIRPPGAP